MSVLNVIVIIRSQGEYIRTVFDVEEYAGEADSKLARNREKYLVDVAAKELANEISDGGFKNNVHRKKIAALSNE